MHAKISHCIDYTMALKYCSGENPLAVFKVPFWQQNYKAITSEHEYCGSDRSLAVCHLIKYEQLGGRGRGRRTKIAKRGRNTKSRDSKYTFVNRLPQTIDFGCNIRRHIKQKTHFSALNYRVSIRFNALTESSFFRQ